MDQPASLGNLWTVITVFTVQIIALAGWTWANLKSKASAASGNRAWEAINALTAALGNFRVSAAESYITKAELMQFRSELERHMDRQFDGLEGSIKDLRTELRALPGQLRDDRASRGAAE